VAEHSLKAFRSHGPRRRRPRIVGVIGSPAELDFALRTSELPDLFELRLDRLIGAIDRLEKKIARLRAPLIVTARHPMEGGAHRLSRGQRHDLLARFLPRARYIDIELRSAPVVASLLRLAREQNVRRIISVHHLKTTPPPSRLRAQASAAKSYGADLFKVATRTDTPEQLVRLIEFATAKDIGIRISAMGIGKLGAASRLLLACCGCDLAYVSLGQTAIEGQLTLGQIRALGLPTPKR